jgi:hypothetical protein
MEEEYIEHGRLPVRQNRETGELEVFIEGGSRYGDDYGGDYDGDGDGDGDYYGEDEFGGPRGRARREQRREQRHERQDLRRENRGEMRDLRSSQKDERQKLRRGGPEALLQEGKPIINSAIANNTNVAAAGDSVLTINNVDEFIAWDLTFDGTTNCNGIKSIIVHKTVVWTVPSGNGVSISVFAANGNLRNVLRGRKVYPGQTIQITGNFSAAGVFQANILGTDVQALDGGCG